jgi:N-acetylmuramoyl-L-alanine amidase
VVLDPGHGGKDHGATGIGGLKEKDAVLAIALGAAKILTRSGVEVTLTRQSDTTLPLEERTAIANHKNADVFVSVHANANKKKSAHGIETYYLDVTDDRYALRLASVENQTSEEEVSELQLILTDLSTKAHTHDSIRLAQRIQTAMVGAVQPLHKNARDLGVKGSLFYVLLGARMPAVLLETSFLPHPEVGTLLGQQGYRDALASAIASAVLEHLRGMSQAME